MARYSRIKFGTQWLTDDGLSTGSACRSQVTGLGALSLSYSGNQFLALDGTPYVQVITTSGRGQSVQIALEQVSETYLEGIVNTINSAVASSSTVTVEIVGDTGDFYLQCVPQFPNPLELSGDFVEGRIRGVTLNLTVKTRLHKLSANAGTYALTGQAASLTEA